MANETIDSNKEGGEKENELTSMHLCFIGGLLVESIKAFQADLLLNYDNAQKIVVRATFIRMMELREKFEHAATVLAA